MHRLGIEAWRRDCGPAPHTLLIRLDGILGRIAPDPAYKVDEQQTLPRLLANISEYMEMAITAWLGIDIAKQKFDVTLNWNSRRRAKRMGPCAHTSAMTLKAGRLCCAG